jgi:hypothetical protein
MSSEDIWENSFFSHEAKKQVKNIAHVAEIKTSFIPLQSMYNKSFIDLSGLSFYISGYCIFWCLIPEMR